MQVISKKFLFFTIGILFCANAFIGILWIRTEGLLKVRVKQVNDLQKVVNELQSSKDYDIKRELTADECVAEGGEIVNTLEQPSYPQERYIGDIVGARCPCVCLKSESVDEPIDTSTWKRYRNEKYGFEVRYPPEFSVWEDNASIRVGLPVTRGGFSDGRYDLYFSDTRIRNNLTLDQFVHNNVTYQRGDHQYQKEGRGIINGIKVYWYTLLLGSGNRKVYFFLKNDNSGIEMNYSGIFRGDDNPLSGKWEQVLSTFKFIE